MKTVLYLTEQLGEQYVTPRDIIAPYTGQDYDKDAEVRCIRYWDDWTIIMKKRYAVEEYDIPEWMTPEEYIGQQINWKYYKAIGGTEEMGRQVYYKITSIENGALRLAAMKLLKTKKFRSAFRKKLREQLENWIEGKSEYDKPFSPKQVRALIDPWTYREAKRIGVAA